ncbi:MAG: tRNA (adenosine(37)-N6)-dimethylallyltransferase MiaA [Bacteroidota bacterium]
MKRVVLCIVGPTASGKTNLALLVAKQLHGEIISADSRQVYKHLDIGTAKPTREQLREVRHHFIDKLEPNENFSAGEFGKKGREIIDDLFRSKKVPIVVGGSGLYVRSLIDGFFEGPSGDNDVRQRLNDRLRDEGAEALLAELGRVDPVSASQMLASNMRRIIRALEVFELTGVPISNLHQQKIKIDFVPLMIGLQWDRKVLYERINRRVDAMLENGFLDEVRRLLGLGYSESTNSLQTVGYQEAILHLRGEIDYHTMVELIKRNTRRFAKRQLTWFRADKRIQWIPITDERDLSAVVERVLHLFRLRCE